MKWPFLVRPLRQEQKRSIGFKAVALRALIQNPTLDQKQVFVCRVELDALEGENEELRILLEANRKQLDDANAQLRMMDETP